MERKLLLLGLLRTNDMHGYQINELIDVHLGTSIHVTKPTVYKLLGDMVDEGWIKYQEEQEGNYPTRRVYKITPDGEEIFQHLLRQSLVDYHPTSHISSIGIMYLDALPGEEAAALLRRRREEIASFAQRIRVDEEHQGGFRLMLAYHVHLLNAELEWLDEVISQLQAP
jgi:DNA-binding PadR family transcriptional regulator